ncbi:putative membrane protein [Pseudarthrobacter siccitolerans]|uniref:Membrane protein n=2 Tax=Pseudarthrobacter siccitolerans TaxID=861266 RepID=A0ABU0PK17_9MICC|nr:putative membrane protein [Pseudarthrobacter siccitolerans]
MSNTDKPAVRKAALRDPLRSSGGMHEASRLQRGVAEFLRLPLMVTISFCVAGVVVSVLDASSTGRSGLRAAAESLVPGGGAVDFVSAVATSLLTVTSITFSVLLLAVQQTASSLTPVVLDQFLRRKPNQAYFGFFVGASAFTFLVLGLAREEGPAPVYGACITLLLTIVALVVLLMLIHATIDQMRPESVMRSIHELALEARESELRLLGSTRVERRTFPGAAERSVKVLDSGYVVTIDLPKLAEVARRVGRNAEILIEGRLGEYLVFAEVVARVVGVDADDDSYDADVLSAFGIDDVRDVDAESGYALDQLENIAWATATSAGQSPSTAIVAVRSLSDLLGRWLISGERDRSDRSKDREELPIVYTDGAVARGLSALSNLVIASAESRQVQTCAELVRSFTRLAPRLHPSDVESFQTAIDACMPAVIQHPDAPALHNAMTELEAALHGAGLDSRRLAHAREAIRRASERMMPKPSDEPEAAALEHNRP